MKIAIFPGFFDPFTLGHYDIVMRSSHLFDNIIIAIGSNSRKTRYFDANMILLKIEETFKDNPKVSVKIYNELTTDFAKKNNATFIIRGIRNSNDFEYEKNISEINHALNANIETVFLLGSSQYSFIRSTIIREIHYHKGNIKPFLPYSL
ncbi:MAG: pantetheine-phosphate adenylyltransferase [Chitinophagaceae bacterium]|nr:pantetheine-phosphate adenylyltransferase [Chitinophagaceae bacterium]